MKGGGDSKKQQPALTGVQLSVLIKRVPTYYVFKIIIILSLLQIMTFMVLWMGRPQNVALEEAGAENMYKGRLSNLSQLFIAAAAFMYVANQNVPKVPYLTALDKMILCVFGNIFACVVETFVIKALLDAGSVDIAISINDAAQYVFPAVCILMTYGQYWQARHVAEENEQDDENEKPHLQETIMAGGGRQRRMSAKALVRDNKAVSHSNIFADHNIACYDRSGQRKRSSFMIRLKKDMVSWRTAASSAASKRKVSFSRGRSARGSLASVSEETANG